jgi:diguanylate cyclase (GGDEF)-like protein
MSTVASKPSILCVDDEPQILEGLSLHLKRHYQVTTATSGAAGLEVLQKQKNFTVIMSDMRMPGMDGATFLAKSRELAPDARRILLTGQTDLSAAIAAINSGHVFHFLQKPTPPPQLLAAVKAAADDAAAEAAEHSALRRQIASEVDGFDTVTGLASPERLLHVFLEAAGNPDGPPLLSVYFIDIDNFSELDDPHDPGPGEQLLQQLADALRKRFPEALVIGRWGADQFVVIAPGGDYDVAALQINATGLNAAVSSGLQLENSPLRVTISVGASRWPTDSALPRTVVKYAELATRQAKRLGAGNSCAFQHEWQQHQQRRRSMRSALHRAIDSDQLALYYQPIVDVAHNQVHALECLARWEHPELGNIPPSVFIPLAEKSGLIDQLGNWVLTRACTEGRVLASEHRLHLAVNVSVVQLMKPGFMAHFDGIVAATGIDPVMLELEITESIFAEDQTRMMEVLSQLHERGARIAIDDFGTGYSSLAYLSQFPVDVLKVDRCFVRTFGTGGESIIDAALSIARNRSMSVVIEGVETAPALQQVRRLGAALVQGYFFARPMTAVATAEWLQRYYNDVRLDDLAGVAAVGT